MEKLNKKEVYDIEVFKTLFSAIFYDGERSKTFSLYGDVNEIEEMLEFIRGKTLIGYNSYFYDNIVINYLFENWDTLKLLPISEINRKLYNLSVMIINLDEQKKDIQKKIRALRYKNHFTGIDLMKVGGIMKSLKLTAVSLKHPKIQDLPYPFDKELTSEEIQNVLEYNWNDVDITWKLYQTLLKEISLREYLAALWKIPSILTESDSGICNKWLDKTYADITGLDLYDFKDKRTKHDKILLQDIIFDDIKFKSPELQSFLQQFKAIEYYSFKESKGEIPLIEFNGLKIQCGFGGIHSEDSPGIFDNKEYKLIDADIGSMYPATIINKRVLARHLDKGLIDAYTAIRDERIAAKKTDKVKADGLKIVLNSYFGKYGFDGSFLKDDAAMLTVTVNGQLYLLMLAEQLMLAGFEVISLNTDGIVTKVPYDEGRELRYHAICEIWEQQTAYELEYTEYDKYIRRDINNYISRTTDGKIKQKGIFETDKPAKKGFDKPIIAISLNNYFLDGKSIHSSIYEHRDIYDFCMAQKIGSTYSRVEYHVREEVTEVQRSLRYFASHSGGNLFKVKWVEEKVIPAGYRGKPTPDNPMGFVDEEIIPAHETKQNLCADSQVVLFNDYFKPPYTLNYKYYIEECNKIVAQVEGRPYVHPDVLEAKITKLEEAVRKNQEKYDKFIEKQSKSKAVATTLATLNKQKQQLAELLKLRQ